MITAFFVHGTGVRRQAYNDLYAVLNRAFAARYPNATLRTCYWGDACGARLHHGGLSIPRYSDADTRAIDSTGDRDIELWARLYDDPLYELRVLELWAAEQSRYSPDDIDIDYVVDKFRRWESDRSMDALADETGIAEDLIAAHAYVLSSDSFNPAVEKVAAGDAQALADVLARSTVASALMMCGSRGRVPLAAIDADIRDRLATRIAAMLLPAERPYVADARGVSNALTAPVTNLLSRAGTFYVQRSRDDVFDAAAPTAGDIVLYQSRGEAFLTFIASEIKDAPRPLVLLTHSLGGVACFDLLALAAKRGAPLAVDLLVTVASQAPFLYELGASRSLLFDEKLPQGFPSWLNIYAPRDFLSYRAKEIFPATIDVEVDIRQPFPRSHSAYWANAQFWAALDQQFKERSWL